MIKYINSKIKEGDMLELTNLVYKNFEGQVLDQLFIKNKWNLTNLNISIS